MTARDMKLADLDLSLSTRRTRKPDVLGEMNRAVPWSALTALSEPHYPEGKTGRPPMGIEAIMVYLTHKNSDRPAGGSAVR